MKTTKIEQIDPIKDKYTKKVGFFKKIQMKFNDFKLNIKSNKSLTEDKKFFMESIPKIVIYGLTASLVSTLFGFSIGVLNFFAFGCGLWLSQVTSVTATYPPVGNSRRQLFSPS